MAFDVVEQIASRLRVHADVPPLFTDESAVLFTSDFGPLGSDRGSDAMGEWRKWRERNPGKTLGACIAWITASFEVDYHAGLLSDAMLEQQLSREAEGDLDLDQAIYALDETIIATALAQLIVDGRADDDGRAHVAIALARQEHPLVLERFFGRGRELRKQALSEAKTVLEASARGERRATKGARPLGRIAGTRIYAPSTTPYAGPPAVAEPEQAIKESMDGGARPGGAFVNAAGRTHRIITEAFYWKLWEADLRLPGFVEIYFRPTSTVLPGTYKVEDAHSFSCCVEVGVEPSHFRTICKGEATADGVELFGGAVTALAERFDLDQGIVDRVRAALRQHGLEFEVVLLTKAVGDVELRASLAFHPDGKHELVVEHHCSGSTRRGAVPFPDPEFTVGELSLTKNVVQVKPTKRSMGPTLKFPVSTLTITVHPGRKFVPGSSGGCA